MFSHVWAVFEEKLSNRRHAVHPARICGSLRTYQKTERILGMEEQQFFFCLFCGVPNTTRKHLPEDQDLKKMVPKVLRCWCFERVDVQVSSVSLVGCFDGTS